MPVLLLTLEVRASMLRQEREAGAGKYRVEAAALLEDLLRCGHPSRLQCITYADQQMKRPSCTRRAYPFDDPMTFKALVREPFLAGAAAAAAPSSGPLAKVLKVLMWRNSKASVAGEYTLPPRRLQVCCRQRQGTDAEGGVCGWLCGGGLRGTSRPEKGRISLLPSPWCPLPSSAPVYRVMCGLLWLRP